MNAISCPQCKAVNALSASECRNCNFPFANIPSTAYISLPASQTYEAQSFGGNVAGSSIPADNETGRKTFLWYRVYCAVLAVLYLALTVLGVFLAISKPTTSEYSSNEMFVMGIIYAVVGFVFFAVSAVALFLPRKPYNWIVGMVMMAIGMTSCCFLPFLIPLLIFWMKPETKVYLGRNP